MEELNNRAEFKKMMQNYASGKASEAEKEFIDAYMEKYEQQDDILSHYTPHEAEQLKAKIRASILNEITGTPKKVRNLYVRWLAAASILLFVSAAGIFYYNARLKTSQIISQNVNKIVPGSNKAILTLSNGKKIDLNASGNGIVAHQKGSSIQKSASGQIIYTADPQTAGNLDNATELNTITTPYGGQCHLLLPDGSRVWLNAASSITYPAVFTGNNRDVSISGEAYFEVAKNKNKPFRVKSGNQTVEVLGTHFNINDYWDEDKNVTTLLEGSVKITSVVNPLSKILKPGEQASTDRARGSITIKDADADKAVAWKNGAFVFTGEDNLSTIMRAIARWYDIKVQYKGKIPELTFTGEVSRTASFDQIIDILKSSGIKMEVSGRTVTVEESKAGNN